MALLGKPRRHAVVFTLALASRAAFGQSVSEYEVKAAYVYNFVKFVEWPPGTLKNPAEPLAICTLGENPFGGALDSAVAGKALDGRKIIVRQVNGASQAKACQVLFVSPASEKSFRAMSNDLRSAGVLAVGESDGFLSAGGVINFKLDSGHVHLQVNMQSVESQGLRISAKLLSLAEVVRK
jgi:hypothetical protein